MQSTSEQSWPSDTTCLTVRCYAVESDGAEADEKPTICTLARPAATITQAWRYLRRRVRAQCPKPPKQCRFPAAVGVAQRAAQRLSCVFTCVYAALNTCFPVLSPFSFAYRVWNIVLSILVIYSIFALPYEVATYWQTMVPMYHYSWIVIDVVFAIDILVSFRIAIVLRAEQKIVYKARAIASRYIKTWFFFDLFAVVPWEAFIGQDAESHEAVFSLYHVYRLPRLVRMGKVIRVFQSVSYIGIVLSLMSLVTSVHVMACLLMSVLKPCFDSSGNLRPECRNAASAGVIYREALYVSLSFGTGATGGTLSLIQKNIDEDRWSTACDFVCVGMTFCSLVLMAWIFANYATYLQENNKRGRQYADKLVTISDECKAYDVPLAMQAMILGYYDFSYAQKENNVITLAHDGNLPINLQCQLAYHMFGSFVDTVPLFARLDARSRMKICTHMYPVVFLPRDRIISRGDLGRKMYFIQHGTVAVVNDHCDPPIELVKLQTGEYFGELAIIYPMLHRTTTVVSVTLCKLLCIEDSAFADIQHFFEAIQQDARGRLERPALIGDGAIKSDHGIAQMEDPIVVSEAQMDNQALATYGDLKVSKSSISRRLDLAVSTRLFLLQRQKSQEVRADLARMLGEVGEVVRAMARQRGIDVVKAKGIGLAKEKKTDMTVDKEIEIVKEQEASVAQRKETDIVVDKEIEVVKEKETSAAQGKEVDITVDNGIYAANENETGLAKEKEIGINAEKGIGAANEKEHNVAKKQGVDVPTEKVIDVPNEKETDVAKEQGIDEPTEKEIDAAKEKETDVAKE